MTDYMNEKCLKQEKSPYSKVNHGFDTGLAIQYGMDCAVVIHHFSYWIDRNQRKGVNFHEGRTWSYQTIKDIAYHFPYWSHKQVERIINKLVEHEVLIKGNFNTNSYDRTSWYAFKYEEMFTISRNREMEKPESGKGKSEIGKPIPHNKTDNKQEDSLSTLSLDGYDKSEESDECVSFFVSQIQEKDPSFKLSVSQRKQWAKDLKLIHAEDGRPWKDIHQIISYALNDPFWASRSNTPKNLRKHATTILLKIKVTPIKPKRELEKDNQALIENRAKENKKYAQDKKSKIIDISDNLCWVKINPKEYLPLGYAEDNFKEILDSLIERSKEKI